MQSVMLQWTFPSPSCSVCGSAWQNRERARRPRSSPFLSLSVASLWPRCGGMVLGPTSQMSLFLLPLLVRTALSAVWAWRRRSPWDLGWWRSRWPEARRSASASGTWAAAAAGPGSWRVLTRSAAERQKGLDNLRFAKRESNFLKKAV